MKSFLEKGVVLLSWVSALLLLCSLLFILAYLLKRGGGSMGLELIFGTVEPVDAMLMRRQVFDGLFPAVAGTFSLIILAVGFALPPGVCTGIYMAEYAHGHSKQILTLLFDVLAGLPSIVVGLAGFSLTILLHRTLPGRIGPCLLLSALSLSFLVLPYIIRTTQTALESVPLEVRLTAPALGATKLQNIFKVLLPSSSTDMLSGTILAIGRAAEDTAVIMLTGAVATAGIVRSLFEQYEALPFYIYYISSQYSDPGELRQGFGAAILLLCLCGLFFIFAFLLEHFISRRLNS